MRSFIKVCTILTLFLVPFNSLFAKKTLRIRNQEQFNNIQRIISSLIESGETSITVKLYPGTYVAGNNQIDLKNLSNRDLRLRIVGKNSFIVPSGEVYTQGSIYNIVFSPGDSWMTGKLDISIWSDVHYVEGVIEVYDKAQGKCRIKSKEPIGNKDIRNAYILIPHWFHSSVYKVEEIGDYYILFESKDLSDGYTQGYNLNDDYNFGQKPIRYKLCNIDTGLLNVSNNCVSLPHGISSVRNGLANCFISIQECDIKAIEVSGVSFLGNSSNGSKSSVYLKNNRIDYLTITNCEFIGQKSDVITIESTSNVLIENNLFKDCYLRGIYSDNNSSNTVVKKNRFYNMGKQMQNTFCVCCRGKDYLITDNEFQDYGYGGIGVGVGYRQIKNQESCGIVEKNHLTFSEAYCKNISNYAIMDGGAIYIWTKNDNAVIRNNVINRYTGMCANRGIYCDDGAYNVQVIDNVITGITNSYCIESRRVSTVEENKTPNSGILCSNINVEISGNIIDGKIFFVGHEELNNGCFKR